MLGRKVETPETPSIAKRATAELIGTFLFVFVGAGSAVSSQYVGGSDAHAALIIACLANGLGLGTSISMTMGVSGGHLNPAVTLGLLVGRKAALRDVAPYIVSQVVGATIAGGLLRVVAPASFGDAVNWGAPSLSSVTSVGQGILFELIMTFFLVFAVYGTIVDQRSPRIGGYGVGLAVAVDVLVGGAFTGAAMNPARAIGPMVAGLYFTNWYVYWIGPIIGGVLAGLAYNYVLLKRQNTAPISSSAS